VGALLERHRPMLFAEALGIPGYRRYDEVEDLVRDWSRRSMPC
jgi:hypothetical protein